MTRSMLFAIVAVFAAVLVAAELVPAAAATPCSGLTALTIPNIEIRSASDVPAGPWTGPGAQSAAEAAAPVAGPQATAITLPAFCRVVGVASPTRDSVINFELWIPPAGAWNGSFLTVGNGGFNGAIGYAALIEGLLRGYASAGSDAGHTGDDLKFGDGHPEKIVDWADRSVHVTAEASKLIVRAYQGKLPRYSYYAGCSTGGLQGLTEAQRYPNDFDGILAGDPAYNRVHLIVGFLWNWLATHNPDGSLILPEAKLDLVAKAAIAACDQLDGLADGLIDDPRACHFDPGKILCRGADDGTCLTAAQVAAVRKVYAGAKDPRTGKQIYPGWEPGSESDISNGTGAAGWRTYFTNPKEPMRTDFWRIFVFHDPNFDRDSFDFDRDVAYADDKMAVANANNPDLSAFRGHGGKLLMYEGWEDPVVAPKDVIGYLDRVQGAMGGPEKTASFLRLFMAPGMGHCRGGAGPNAFDALGALSQWVEHGAAPEKIVAAHFASGAGAPSGGTSDLSRTKLTPDRTRPLCPYPQVARWTGSGSKDDAANFNCADAVEKKPPKATVTIVPPPLNRR